MPQLLAMAAACTSPRAGLVAAGRRPAGGRPTAGPRRRLLTARAETEPSGKTEGQKRAISISIRMPDGREGQLSCEVEVRMAANSAAASTAKAATKGPLPPLEPNLNPAGCGLQPCCPLG